MFLLRQHSADVEDDSLAWLPISQMAPKCRTQISTGWTGAYTEVCLRSRNTGLVCCLTKQATLLTPMHRWVTTICHMSLIIDLKLLYSLLISCSISWKWSLEYRNKIKLSKVSLLREAPFPRNWKKNKINNCTKFLHAILTLNKE